MLLGNYYEGAVRGLNRLASITSSPCISRVVMIPSSSLVLKVGIIVFRRSNILSRIIFCTDFDTIYMSEGLHAFG